MNSIKIILLPGGKWCLEVNGNRSEPHGYGERIIWLSFLGQTDYWGEEMVFHVGDRIDHETVDSSAD